jgi:2-hydroxycyclohexanecarboxyl-CoA dehydrogenase
MTIRVAVVTGGAQGIGLAISRRLSDDGFMVGILDINGDEAIAAAGLVGGGAIGIQCDVADIDQMQKAAKRISTDLGPCHALVANTGWTRNVRFLDTTLEDQKQVIDVNYVGSLHATRVFLPDMLSEGHGRIVFIASDAARVGVAGEAVYAGSKAALIGFSKSLAVEVARHGVTVNVVCPGSTDTPLLHAMFSPEQIQRRISIHPMRRLAKPEDIAGAVRYFVDDDAEFVTGQVLSVSGGMLRAG